MLIHRKSKHHDIEGEGDVHVKFSAQCADVITAAGGIVSTAGSGTMTALQSVVSYGAGSSARYLKSFFVNTDDALDSESTEEDESMKDDISVDGSKSVDDKVEDNTSTKHIAIMTLIGGTIAAATFAMTPAALCIVGFGPEGVVAGSVAASWQSTMPLVAKGSLFSYLQSVTTASSGSMTALQSITGFVSGSAGVSYLKNFFVDTEEMNSDSTEVNANETINDVATSAHNEEMTNAPCLYRMCAAGKEMLTNLTNTATNKNKGYEQITASKADNVSEGKASRVIGYAARTTSSLWNTVKECSSVTTTLLNEKKMMMMKVD